MDTKQQIKRDLIAQIQKSNDLSILKTLQNLLDASTDAVYRLSSEQTKSIDISKEQLKNGEVISHQKLMTDMERWLQNQ